MTPQPGKQKVQYTNSPSQEVKAIRQLNLVN